MNPVKVVGSKRSRGDEPAFSTMNCRKRFSLTAPVRRQLPQVAR